MEAAFLGIWRGEGPVPADLDARLRALVGAAAAAWPEVRIPESDFLAHLAGRLPARDLAGALDNLSPADLYLACGCARGLPPAVAAFDARFLSRVPVHVRRIDAAPAFAAEIQQALRVKLLVGDGQPRIAQYSGACPLDAWVRVVAVREALTLLRKGQEVPSDPQDLPAAPAVSFDRELIRLRYQSEFQAALDEALTGLDARDRNLLRLHYVDRLGIDALGAMFNVHRTTCARWIVAAQEKLLGAVRQRLQAQLGIDSGEFHSLAGLLLSGLHISMTRALAD
jgi:RNA polymerase sigma-70 factor, ECF subfamily